MAGSARRWMDGRVVSYQGRAGSCGSTTLRKGCRSGGKGVARRKRGSSGLVLPASTGGVVGWGDRYAVPSPVPHTTPPWHVHCASATAEGEDSYGEYAIVSERHGELFKDQTRCFYSEIF